MLFLNFSSGSSTNILFENLRLIALSISKGLLVAAINVTFYGILSIY